MTPLPSLSSLPLSRVSVQKTSVCRFKTSPCVPAPRPHVVTHAGVVPVHTEAFLNVHTGTPHTPHHTTTHTTPHTPHNTTTHTTPRQRQRDTETETERNRERQRETERDRKRDETRQEKKREETRRWKRRDEKRPEKKKSRSEMKEETR